MKYALMAITLAAGVILGHQRVTGMDAKETRMDEETGATRSAVFAGGCFWCTESDFEKVDGVIEVVSGYTGGRLPDPTYEQVSSGGTGHVEAVRVVYDPARIDYERLLEIFWQHVDPTDPGGQFVDRGAQYRSAVFYADETERRLAERTRDRLAARGPFDKPIVTDILPLGEFYPAEEYHQDYYRKNPLRYRFYRSGSGRDRFLEEAWKTVSETTVFGGSEEEQAAGTAAPATASGKSYTVPNDETLRRTLSPLQYQVTQEDATEPPFRNAFWDNHEPGIYVDIVSGEPLFSSTDKFDSGTGWPSFTRPLEKVNIVEKTDRSLFMTRTEVRSRHADSHLGHVFADGPAPTGRRYCINSAALRFVPAADLEKEGYGEYRRLFR